MRNRANLTPNSIYPLSTGRDDSGGISISGFSVIKLAEAYGTPLYIYDAATIRSQVDRIRELAKLAYPGEIEICYAAKAYFSLEFAKRLSGLNLGIDAVSLDELIFAQLAGFPNDKIHLHGNNKSEEELKAAMAANVHAIVADSLEEIGFIESLAAQQNRKVKVWLRLNPNITVDTHPYRITAHAASKFGIPIEGGHARMAISQAQASPHLELIGLHAHLGSQIFQHEPYVKAIAILYDFAGECHFTFNEISVGGGWGVPYTDQDNDFDIDQWFTAVSQAIHTQCQDRGWGLPKLIVEPGRWLVARAGLAVYTIGTSKFAMDGSYIVSVDGGMGDNIRPALYSAHYTGCIAERPDAEVKHMVRVAGKFCESGDELISELQIPDFQRGDHLVMPVAGAYQLSMTSNYNLAPRPTVLWLERDRIEVLQRRTPASKDPWWTGNNVNY